MKAYAIDYCGAKTLREATREQVENFVQHLADWAEKDRDALLCQLNSYLADKGRCRMKRHIQVCTKPIRLPGTRSRMDCTSFVWPELSIGGTDRSPITFSALLSSNLSLLAGHSITGRIYCTPKALWKLSWFLRDFGYDPELIGRDEIDDKCLVGLQGVVKISRAVLQRHFPTQP